MLGQRVKETSHVFSFSVIQGFNKHKPGKVGQVGSLGCLPLQSYLTQGLVLMPLKSDCQEPRRQMTCVADLETYVPCVSNE